MMTLQIEIINPTAKKLLENLASMQLIKISKRINYKKDFSNLLDKLRDNENETLTLEEIQKEVETVRKERYAIN